MIYQRRRKPNEFWQQRRVFVTGATGFLGSHMIRQLVKMNAEVFAFVRPGAQSLRINDLLDRIHVVEGDLLDVESARAGVERADPEFVYHLGAFGVDRPLQEPKQAALVNVVGTVHLLEVLRERVLSRFVYAGTCYEYSGEITPIGPGASLKPANVYAATKSGGALVCQAYQRMFGLPLVIVRPFQSYGPWQSIRLLIPYVIVSLLKGDIVRLTSGKQIRDFIFVEDVVNGLLLACEKDTAIGETFNIGNGQGIPVRIVVERILELLGKDGRVEFEAVPHRPGEVWELWSDNTIANNLLGWSPDISLLDGLGKTINWYKANMHLIDQLARV